MTILYQDNRIIVCLKPAGVVSVDEAGGTVTAFEGDAYDPHDRHIIATNTIFHKELSDIVRKDG